jgi:hypothetical protein
MKRKVLSMCVAVVSLITVSCEKNDQPSENGTGVATMRSAGVGSSSGSGCVTPTMLVMEKNGHNNNFQDLEGTVEIHPKSDRIDVKYKCNQGFGLRTVTVWIGPKSKAPVNSVGHPDFGNFQVHVGNLDNIKNYTVSVPRAKISISADPSDPMIAIAHANVFGHNLESSYGKGLYFHPGGKAQYIVLNPACGFAIMD